jgi:hypothetical protein
MLQMPEISRTLLSVEQGSATAVLAAIGKEYEGKGGFYMENCGVAEEMAGDVALPLAGFKPWAYDPENEDFLWQDSMELLGMKDS